MKTAALIAIIGNALLALLKIIAGIIANSSALIGDGIDSTGDVLVSIVSHYVAKIMSRPADLEHPWGHGRAETIATAFLSFIIFFAGAQLFINSLWALFSPLTPLVPTALAFTVSIISIFGKAILAGILHLFAKRTDSLLLRANAKNMLSDILISSGVLLSLVISKTTASSLPDIIISVMIGIWIIRTAVGIFLESNLELMDGNKSLEPYRVIMEAVSTVPQASNPHRCRMRRIAGFCDIDLDISVDPHCSVAAAHKTASQVENAIKKRLENVFDIVIHVEPLGDKTAEAYGLSEELLNENDE